MKQLLRQITISILAFIFGGILTTGWHYYKNNQMQKEQDSFAKKVAFVRGNFSSDDIFQIRKLIATKTNEELVSIRLDEDRKIEIMTGFQRGPLDGGGKLFIVKKENDQWIITDQSVWAS